MHSKIKLVQLVLVLKLILYVHSEHNSLSLTFEVENNDEFCLYHQFNNSIEYVLNYGVLNGGSFDIDFSLSLESTANNNEESKILYIKKQMVKKDSVHFYGNLYFMHKFCFRNYFSPISHKTVFIDIQPADKSYIETLRQEADHNQLPVVLTSTDAALNEIHVKLTNLSNVQYYFRYEESIDRNFAEFLRFKVTLISGVEFTMIIMAALIEASIVKQFFSSKQLK